MQGMRLCHPPARRALWGGLVRLERRPLVERPQGVTAAFVAPLFRADLVPFSGRTGCCPGRKTPAPTPIRPVIPGEIDEGLPVVLLDRQRRADGRAPAKKVFSMTSFATALRINNRTDAWPAPGDVRSAIRRSACPGQARSRDLRT